MNHPGHDSRATHFAVALHGFIFNRYDELEQSLRASGIQVPDPRFRLSVSRRYDDICATAQANSTLLLFSLLTAALIVVIPATLAFNQRILRPVVAGLERLLAVEQRFADPFIAIQAWMYSSLFLALLALALLRPLLWRAARSLANGSPRWRRAGAILFKGADHERSRSLPVTAALSLEPLPWKPLILFFICTSLWSLATFSPSTLAIALLLPFTLGAPAALMIVMMGPLFVLASWARERGRRHVSQPRVSAYVHLLAVREQVACTDWLSHAETIKCGIMLAAHNIEHIHGTVDDSITHSSWSSSELFKAAHTLRALVHWVDFPQPTTREDLAKVLQNYLSALEAGYLHALPRDERFGSWGTSARAISLGRRLATTVAFSAYMMLPTLGYYILRTTSYVLEFEGQQYVAIIFYACWSMPALLLFGKLVDAETRRLFFDLIRELRGRAG